LRRKNARTATEASDINARIASVPSWVSQVNSASTGSLSVTTKRNTTIAASAVWLTEPACGHDLAQLEHLYAGREVARTVLSNAKLRMLLPGVGDLETLRYWSELMGRTVVHSHGVSWGADGHRSRSRSEHDDPLAPLHLLQQLPGGKAVLVYENLPPARIRLRRWYTDRRLMQAATAEPNDQQTTR
jgi:hypothetical protein